MVRFEKIQWIDYICPMRFHNSFKVLGGDMSTLVFAFMGSISVYFLLSISPMNLIDLTLYIFVGLVGVCIELSDQKLG